MLGFLISYSYQTYAIFFNLPLRVHLFIYLFRVTKAVSLTGTPKTGLIQWSLTLGHCVFATFVLVSLACPVSVYNRGGGGGVGGRGGAPAGFLHSIRRAFTARQLTLRSLSASEIAHSSSPEQTLHLLKRLGSGVIMKGRPLLTHLLHCNCKSSIGAKCAVPSFRLNSIKQSKRKHVSFHPVHNNLTDVYYSKGKISERLFRLFVSGPQLVRVFFFLLFFPFSFF